MLRKAASWLYRFFGKYQQVVYLSVILAITICVMVGMSLMYVSSRSTIEKEIQKSNTALLSIAQSRMDDALNKVAVSSLQLALDPLIVKYFAFQPQMDLWDLNLIQTKVAVMQAADNTIHSVYLYYLNTPYMITNYGVYAFDTFHDKSWLTNAQDLEPGFSILPKRDIDYIDHTQHAQGLTLLRKLPLGRLNRSAFLVVNLDTDVLLSQIRGMVSESESLLFVSNAQQRIINYSGMDDLSKYAELVDKIIESVQDDLSGKKLSFDGKEYVLTAIHSTSTGLSYYIVQPITQYYSSLQRFAAISLWFILIILSIGILLAIIVSNRLYRPVKGLLNTTKGGNEQSTYSHYQEFRLLGEWYKNIAKTNDELDIKAQQYYPLICEKITRDILYRDNLTDTSMEERIKLAELTYPQHALHYVIGYHIDQYRDYSIEYSCEERANFESDARNLLMKKLGKWCWTNAIVSSINPAEAYYLVALENNADATKALIKECKEICEEIKSRYPFSVTIGIGSPQNFLQEIPSSMREASIAMAYRFVLGPGQTINYAQAVPRGDLAIHFPVDIERRLCKYIRTGDTAKMHDCLSELFVSKETAVMLQVLGPQSVYTHYVNCVVSLLYELGYCMEDFTESTGDVAMKLFEVTEITDFETFFTDFCDAVVSFNVNRQTPIGKKIYDCTEQFIMENYQQDITISSLSGVLMYSPTHINRMLKQTSGKTFNDLLCERRMGEAKKLLINTRMTINEIAKATGFNSVQSFNRVYKSMEGLTPTMYRNKEHLG